MKEKIMDAKNIEDLMEIEAEFINEIRNNMYNELLEDEVVKKHLCEILKVEEDALENVLVINDHPPLDDFISE